EDFGSAIHLTSRGVSRAAVDRVATALAEDRDVETTRGTTSALVRLVDLGAVVWDAGGEVRWTSSMTVDAVLAASDAETSRENEIERSRLEMMRHYAENRGCRRVFMLSYFGQKREHRCGTCDNDLSAMTDASVLAPFEIGARVHSERWGDGTVQR